MRVLFVLEPVVFQGAPEFLSAHFFWADTFAGWARHVSGEFALLGNPTICDLWLAHAAARGHPSRVFTADPFRAIASSGYSRALYAKSLYTGAGGQELTRRVAQIASEYDPDFVVMTSQSMPIRSGLGRRPILSIEQAPLPRLGHPVRTMLDPCGHQVGSILETEAARIRSLPLSADQIDQAFRLLGNLQRFAARAHPQAEAAQGALRALAGDRKVALLATQPVDWVTYEGAYRRVEIETLLYLWADQLPDGWVGVPTYHPGQRLGARIEHELMRSHPKLCMLPPEYSQGLTEALLCGADGLVTISSTSAVSSLLFGKATIVTGHAPFRAWCPYHPAQIGTAPRMKIGEAARLLVFLTNRVVERNQDLDSYPDRLSKYVERALLSRNVDWLFDISEWSMAHTHRLFADDATSAAP